MNRLNSFSILALSMIVLLLALTIWLQPARADQTAIATPMVTATPINQQDNSNKTILTAEQEELKGAIQSYFETRYRVLSTLQLNEMDDLVSGASAAQGFLDSERSKLAIEIKNAELNHLRYVDYKYFLDFKTITVNQFTQTAIVSVIEGHDVIFEISKELNPDNPIISKMRNLEHLIVLHKEENQWKVVSDKYEDDLWRLLRQTGTSTAEMLSGFDVPRDELHPLLHQNAVTLTYPLCPSLPADDSTHTYYRADAVAYAHQYADEDPIQLRNPNYPNYPNDDCANFVSQAIYEGGKASMAIPSTLPPPSNDGQLGWYLLNDLQRASAWNDVDSLYDFITDTGADWDEGPEGCELSEAQQNLAEPGDLIKFDWTGNGSWDHMAMIVSTEDDAQGNRMYSVAAHTTDHDDYPYTYFYITHPDMEFKLIHIERSDGYPPIKTEVAAAEDDTSGDPGYPGMRACNAFTTTDPGNNYFGGCIDSNTDIRTGFRFANLPIPAGATIKYAYIIFNVDNYGLNDDPDNYNYFPISLLAHGDASQQNFTQYPLANRVISGPSVPWIIDGTVNGIAYDTWVSGKKRATPDLKNIIRPIIASGNWSYGNAFSIIFTNVHLDGYSGTFYNHRRVAAYEGMSPYHIGYFPTRLIAAYSYDPYVLSSARTSADPANSIYVGFTVTFSEPVTGVDTGDFTLTTAGITNASVSSVVGSGDTYTVTVNTGSGDGTLRLDVNDGDTGITDLDGNPLSGGFTNGEAYTIDKTPPDAHIDTQPPPASNSTSATFTFSSTDSAATFECKLDAGVFATCTSPANYTNLADGSHTFYLQARDQAGNLTATPVTYTWTVEAFPTVISILTAGANPSDSAQLVFTVTFSESVTGVNASDFTITQSDPYSNAAVSQVNGSGDTYTVTVSATEILNDSTLRLDVTDNDTIKDTDLNKLGGTGVGNGNFTSGQTYAIDRLETLRSVGANDGWVLESTETSGVGGTLNATATTFRLGDDAADKQYRSILHFDTSSLPDTAVITSVELIINYHSVVGTEPTSNLLVDIRKPYFSTTADLVIGDFQAAASKSAATSFTGVTMDENGLWFSAYLASNDYQYVNLTGTTQFRLRYAVDDNNNNSADYCAFYSGNAAFAHRPQLVIYYYVP